MTEGAAPEIDQARLYDALRDVIDPELGMDVVELGMVGNLEVAGRDVVVDLRLTSMSCPFWDLFVDQVKTALADVDGIGEVAVRFDRRNPWTPELLSEKARAQLELTGLMPPSGGSIGRGQLIQLVDGVLSAPGGRR
jgi:metal-sulfur cluster biosynthetic enzyme